MPATVPRTVAEIVREDARREKPRATTLRKWRNFGELGMIWWRLTRKPVWANCRRLPQFVRLASFCFLL